MKENEKEKIKMKRTNKKAKTIIINDEEEAKENIKTTNKKPRKFLKGSDNKEKSSMESKITKAKKKIKDFLIKSDDEIDEDEDEKEDEKEVKLVGFRLTEVIVLIVIATIIGVFGGSFLTYNFANGNGRAHEDTSEYISEFEEAYQNVIDNYYEEVDKDELIDAAIDGMLSTLDGYTSYMNAEETLQFNERMNGEYHGIGIEFMTAAGYVHTITRVFENTPAETAGVQVGDTIIKIDAIDASTITGTDIAAYIKGESISQITMVVRRNDKDVTLTIKKTLVSIPSVTKKTFDMNGKKAGYINISLFADNTYDQFSTALTSLEAEGINSLVIDVRDNSGGYLHAAKDILQLFLAKGDIMYQMENQSGTTKFQDETDENREYSVAVLINGNSASASEILAAAMKEVYGAQIFGTTSYGKGTVQQPSDLASGGMIKVTTDKWLTPNGNWLDKEGLIPTTEIEQGESYSSDPTDLNDIQLQKALETVTK